MANAVGEISAQLEFLKANKWTKCPQEPGECCLVYAIPADAAPQEGWDEIDAEDYQSVHSEQAFQYIEQSMQEHGIKTSHLERAIGRIIDGNDDKSRGVKEQAVAEAILTRALVIAKQAQYR